MFGPLAPCGNCEKTKKACTFEWLRSQRVSQASPPSTTSSNNAHPPKRRRKSKASASQQAAEPQQSPAEVAPELTGFSDSAAHLGITFADFPTGMPTFDLNDPVLLPFGTDEAIYANGAEIEDTANTIGGGDDQFSIEHDSAKHSMLDAVSEGRDTSQMGDSPSHQGSVATTSDNDAHSNETALQKTRKRRRRSGSALASIAGTSCLSPASLDTFLSSTNNAFLTESLLKIYHDSFENALSCWLTERTCPYSRGSEVSLACNKGPDWNRIYHRVFRLDRLSAPIRGRRLTVSEDRAASRALNLAIFSFATQWAQSSDRSKANYPFRSDDCGEPRHIFTGNSEAQLACKDFDRTLQISAWHEARMALRDAVEIESFRVVLAQIVFSLTQKPTDPDGVDTNSGRVYGEHEPISSVQASTPRSLDEDVDECGDLLAKLDLTIEGEGPPVHLEQGLRLIHALRSKVAMAGTFQPPSVRTKKGGRPSEDSFNPGDRVTVDLLFWLGIMFDTLSSAMHKRPLVVSDEDSDIFTAKSESTQTPASRNDSVIDLSINPTPASEGIWESNLYINQNPRTNRTPIRWPCTQEQAAALLCDAAPVKVLLFRKVTRIQTLLSRNIRGEKIERALAAALEVYRHWETLYAPFIRDCIDNHDDLSPRIQSWYVCLTGHWHLATLLLADLIQIIDTSDFGIASRSQQRTAANFLQLFRLKNCRDLSDIAWRACPREDASFAKSSDFHFAVNQGALLTEPWTVVLIRAFAKAGVVLLDSESEVAGPEAQNDAFERAESCVKALWYLGRKSDMALEAARILGAAVKQRRKCVVEKLSEMNCLLNAELWGGLDAGDGVFGFGCE